MYSPARIFCISPYLQIETVQSYDKYKDWLETNISSLRKHYIDGRVPVLVFPEFIGLPLLTRNKNTATKEFFRAFSEIARNESCYVVASNPESIDGIFYNVAHIFDPRGNSIFSLKKYSLTEEELTLGISAGSSNQAKMIELPFARTGIGICLDAFNPYYISELTNQKTTLLLQPSANNQQWAAPALSSGVWQPLEWTQSIVGAVSAKTSIEMVINPMLRGTWVNGICFDGQSSIVTKSLILEVCPFVGVTQSFHAHFEYCGNNVEVVEDEFGWIDIH